MFLFRNLYKSIIVNTIRYIPNIEIDSIELATPKLFSDEVDQSSFENLNQETENFGNLENENFDDKEPEMFEEKNSEEDFEIPAFLRKQKN